MTQETSGSSRELKLRIDQVVRSGGDLIVPLVQQALADAIQTGKVYLEPRFRQVKPEAYARRLLYREPSIGYTAVVMTWAPGQRTPIHDHAGIWCVEGVVEGEIDVRRYELVEENGELVRFSSRLPIHASVGSTGCLIPPQEYHVVANSSVSRAITLHIYGGEMDRCNVYTPRADGWYERASRSLSYEE